MPTDKRYENTESLDNVQEPVQREPVRRCGCQDKVRSNRECVGLEECISNKQNTGERESGCEHTE